MQTSWRKAGSVVAALTAGTIFGAGLSNGVARADLLGSVLKGGGIAFLIKQFNRPINDGINKLTGSAGAPQVSGPQDALNNVQAVGLLEGGLNGKTFRLKALVPINTNKPNGKTGLSRVKGVGVSAIVDIHV